MTSDAELYVYKDIPIYPQSITVDVNGQLKLVTGGLTFDTNADANQVYLELLSLLDSPQVRNKIEYAEVLLLSNTHHYQNPLPDQIISQTTGGDILNLDAYTTFD